MIRLARLSSSLLSRKGGAAPVGGAFAGSALAEMAPAPCGSLPAPVFGRKGVAAEDASPQPARRPARQAPRSGRRGPVALTLRLDRERFRQLKITAARTERSCQDLIRAALDAYLPDVCPACACQRAEDRER